MDFLEVGLNMKNILVYDPCEPSPRKRKAELFSLKDKVEILKIQVDEVQKYELLTTNQYLKHMELVVSILEDLSSSQVQSKDGIGGEMIDL